jgi:hypothetical protein
MKISSSENSFFVILFLCLIFTNSMPIDSEIESLISMNANKTIDKELESYKHKIKEKIMRNANKCEYSTLRNLRAIGRNDMLGNLFCDPFEDNLNNLPLSGRADVMPWSGYYWPIKNGVISVRYSPNEKNTVREYNPVTHTLTRPLTWEQSVTKYKQPEEHKEITKNLQGKNLSEYINENYSPSEKYDFLVGDYDYTLTNMMKAEGYYVKRDPDGDVAGWMGICHGWSPASYMEKRPQQSVKLLASDGVTEVEFLPDDIKALVTLFWAEGNYTTKFIGSNCRYENRDEIPSDPETGLWTDPNCFSLSPAALTIAMANQIGIKKKNLIFDPDSNGEIWNQPVYSYEMNYFHLLKSETYNRTSTTLTNSKVSVSDLEPHRDDKFINLLLKNKSTNTKTFVGMTMTVNFIFELGPIHGVKHREDNKQKSKYMYVLELDENDKIVGGEWVHNSHPTFIWMPDEHTKISTYEDRFVERFTGSVEELKNISNFAAKASKRKTPLKAIVNYLVNLSSAARLEEI